MSVILLYCANDITLLPASRCCVIAVFDAAIRPVCYAVAGHTVARYSFTFIKLRYRKARPDKTIRKSLRGGIKQQQKSSITRCDLQVVIRRLIDHSMLKLSFNFLNKILIYD